MNNNELVIIDNNSNLKNLKSFCGKRDAFDCAGIRARIFRLLEIIIIL